MKQRFGFRKRRTPPPPRKILVWAFILFIGMIILSLWMIDRGIEPTLMNIAEIKTEEFATRAINAAVEFTDELEFEDLVNVQTATNGHVTQIGWNSAVVNKVLRTSTDRVEYFLHNMNKGEMLNTKDPKLNREEYGESATDMAQRDPTLVEIPIGQATGNTILANLGPKIPVHFEVVGNIKTDVNHEVEEFGLNSALYKIYVDIQVDVQIVIPFATSVSKVRTKIFIASGVLMGEVPEFYGKEGGPSISVPKDSMKKE